MRHVEKDGRTTAEHIAGLAERNPRARRLLEGPPFPEVLRYLWDWFLELDDTRQSIVGGMGDVIPLPITYSDIASWATLTGAEIQSHEVKALRRLDVALLYPPKED